MKKCKNCSKEFTAYNTLQKYCVSCAIEKGRAKTWKTKKAKMREDLKTRSQKINEARVIFQQYIRLRDKDKPCISCGTTTATKWDAGHYLKAELYTGLIFEENNCHKQCQRCNQYGGGMQIEYRIGLVERIGEASVKALEIKKDALRVHRWSDYELSQIKERCKDKIQKLK